MFVLLSCATLICGEGTVQAGKECVVDPDGGDSSGGDSAEGDSAEDTGGDTRAGGETGDETAESGDDTGDAVLEVYLLAGQSNMDGYGYYTGLPPAWREAALDIPLYWSGWGEFRPLQPASSGGAAYMGPEVAVGQTLAGAGRQVALVKHAVGGTDLANYWDPGASDGDPATGDGWTVLAASVRAATEALDAEGRPWRWAGFVWMQGESDALDAGMTAAYEANLTNLLAEVRALTGVAELPASIGLIACEGLCTYLDEVRAAQEAVAAADPNVHLVETLDLPRNTYDGWHYDGPSERVLGVRLAQALLDAPQAPPPEAALRLTAWRTDYDGNFTIGWRFSLDRPIVLTDVGGFAPAAYLYSSQEWGLWDRDTRSLLVRETVPGWLEAPTSYREGFWYTAIDPVELPPGDYVVGLVSWAGDADRYANEATGTLGPGLTYTSARYVEGYWLTYPSSELVPNGTLSFLGPSFLYVEG